MYGVYEEQPVFVVPFHFVGSQKELTGMRPGHVCPVRNGIKASMLPRPAVNYDSVAGAISEDV